MAIGRQFHWVNNERLAFDLENGEAPATDQNAAPGLFAVDHDGKRYQQLVERQMVWLKNGNASGQLELWNTSLLNAKNQRTGVDVLVYRPQQFDGAQVSCIKPLRLNTVTGRATELDVPKHAVRWWFDGQGELRVTQTLLVGKGAMLWLEPSAAWKTLREFEPGSKFRYSNTGFLLLGRAVEQVSGQSFAAYLQDHLFKPAGMTQTSLDPAIPVAAATGFMRFLSLRPAAESALPGSPAGGVSSSVGDLARFFEAL
jgi:hypothetical protein